MKDKAFLCLSIACLTIWGFAGASHASPKQISTISYIADVRFVSPANGHDEVADMAQDTSGNVYLAGLTENTLIPARKYDALLIKYNSAGVKQWQATYNGPDSNYDHGTKVVLDSSDNPILVGGSPGVSSGTDVFARKYTPAGALVWTFRWDSGLNGEDTPSCAATGPAGETYIAGERRSATDTDLFLIKVDSAGALVWQIVFDTGFGDDTISSIKVDNAGNVFVGGSLAMPFTDDDAFAAKINAAGTPLWLTIYDAGFGRRECTADIQLDASGNLLLAGTAWKPDPLNPAEPQTDMFTLKIDPAGNQLWALNVDGGLNDQDECVAMALDSSGNVIMTGPSYGGDPDLGGTSNDFLVAKVNSTGTLAWATRYNSPINGPDLPSSLIVGRGGFIYVAGSCWSTCAPVQVGNTDALATVKLNGSGSVLGTMKFQGTAADGDAGVAIVQSSGGNLWIAGNSYGATTGLDIVLVSQSP